MDSMTLIAVISIATAGLTTGVAYAGRVLAALNSNEALVPGIWGLEVANVVARLESQGRITEARAELFVATLLNMNIVVDRETSDRLWAPRFNWPDATNCLLTKRPIWNWRCARVYRWRLWMMRSTRLQGRPA